MTQDEVLEVIKKYPDGVLFSEISKECINPGFSIGRLYKRKLITRKREGNGFRYWYVIESEVNKQ